MVKKNAQNVHMDIHHSIYIFKLAVFFYFLKKNYYIINFCINDKYKHWTSTIPLYIPSFKYCFIIFFIKK